MNLIADTNVWYDIGAKIRDPVKLKEGGNRLLATPTNLMEICSLINDNNLDVRRNAAQAVVDHADEVLKDCEYHLSTLWGLPTTDPMIPWLDGFKAIAQASSAKQLETGVVDSKAKVRRTANVPLTKAWRAYHWDDFCKLVVNAIDEHVPGYKAARLSGSCKHLGKKEGIRLADTLRSQGMKKAIVEGTFLRALLVVNQAERRPSQGEYDQAEPLISPYVDAYIEYIIGCATEFAPQPNDLGDSDCFIYLQGDNSFLSSDKRWVKIARKACPTHFLDPEKKVP